MYIIEYTATDNATGERYTSTTMVGGFDVFHAEANFWASHVIQRASNVSIISTERV